MPMWRTEHFSVQFNFTVMAFEASQVKGAVAAVDDIFIGHHGFRKWDCTTEKTLHGSVYIKENVCYSLFRDNNKYCRPVHQTGLLHAGKTVGCAIHALVQRQFNGLSYNAVQV